MVLGGAGGEVVSMGLVGVTTGVGTIVGCAFATIIGTEWGVGSERGIF